MINFTQLSLRCPHCGREATTTVAGWNEDARVYSAYDCPKCRQEIDVHLPGRAIWAGQTLTDEHAAQRLRFLESIDAAIQQNQRKQRPAVPTVLT